MFENLMQGYRHSEISTSRKRLSLILFLSLFCSSLAHTRTYTPMHTHIHPHAHPLSHSHHTHTHLKLIQGNGGWQSIYQCGPQPWVQEKKVQTFLHCSILMLLLLMLFCFGMLQTCLKKLVVLVVFTSRRCWLLQSMTASYKDTPRTQG